MKLEEKKFKKMTICGMTDRNEKKMLCIKMIC